MRQPVDWKADVRLLVHTLRRASRTTNKGGRKTNTSGHIELPPEIELLEDYEKNGLFDTKERNYRLGIAGKIDWGRTIKNTNPVQGKNGTPVYIEPIVGFSTDSLGIIKKLHAYAVGIADEKFSWLVYSDGKPRAKELHGKRPCSARRPWSGEV